MLFACFNSLASVNTKKEFTFLEYSEIIQKIEDRYTLMKERNLKNKSTWSRCVRVFEQSQNSMNSLDSNSKMVSAEIVNGEQGPMLKFTNSVQIPDTMSQ